MPIKKKSIPESEPSKPLLIKAGNSYIDPTDVSSIYETKKGLYVVKMKSSPDPRFPIWVHSKDIGALIAYFKIEGEEV